MPVCPRNEVSGAKLCVRAGAWLEVKTARSMLSYCVESVCEFDESIGVMTLTTRPIESRWVRTLIFSGDTVLLSFPRKS